MNLLKIKVMPKWSLEVCKMFLYMMFPVGCFHYFNNPQIFEESVIKLKRETAIAVPPEKQQEIRAAIKKVKDEVNLKRLQKLEESEKNRQASLRI